LQYELLKVLEEQSPHAYARAVREIGLTLDQADMRVKRSEVVSASRAIKLVRLIMRESNWRELLGQAGSSLFDSLYRELPFSIRATIRILPRPLRVPLAIAITRRITHSFAGGSGRLITRRRSGHFYLTVADGAFSERMETLDGAREFYRAFLEEMFRRFARVGWQVKEIKCARVRLHECCFEVTRSA
jgi:hypothetical protein